MTRTPPRLWPALVVGAVALTGSALALGALLNVMGAHLRKLPIYARDGLKLHTLPTSFPQESPRWVQARPDEIASAEGVEELGTENYLTRWYMRKDETLQPGERPTTVQLHLAYYTGMIDTVPHVPERCMVGGGMEMAADPRRVPANLDFSLLTPDPYAPPDEEGRPVWMGRSIETHSRVRLPRGIERLELTCTPFRDQSAQASIWAGYFFIANGGVVASANDVRLLAFRLTDDYAYYVKVQFLSPSVDSAEELAEIAADMLNHMFPDLMRRLPDWVDVQAGLYPPDNPRRPVAQAALDRPAR